MSLYNALFGTRREAPVVLAALAISEANVPRFRDAYYDTKADRLVIYTRTGGGNRDFYEDEATCRANHPEYFGGKDDDPSGPWNADLRALPGFISDEDNDFDCTYASFFFHVPEAFAPLLKGIVTELGETETPADRWQRVLKELADGADTPEAQRARDVGKQIAAQIEAATKVGA